ncbi:MAG: hypothetical protein HKO93_00530, partial [Flavobacteriales bacterium]|nr:hypothetical protein [Flavobacteriales bacterium]
MIRNFFFVLILLASTCQTPPPEQESAVRTTMPANYEELVTLFKEWRTFEEPPIREGAPDYTAKTFDQRLPQFKALQNRLLAMDIESWPLKEQIDWVIIWAEMNGYDFNYRVLQPWKRDPAFYKNVWTYRSDVPAHEGPTNHATTELWTYTFPLSEKERARLINDLGVIPPLNAQAKLNLTGNAKDLWVAGIRDIKGQGEDLKSILEQPGVNTDEELKTTAKNAIQATDELANWLESEAPNKTGPSGIGKENYTWYLHNVHLVPLTWEDEVMILKRELARAWYS